MNLKHLGYAITDESRGSGRSVKGRAKTRSIQVRLPVQDGYLLKGQFRYTVDDTPSFHRAFEKAKAFVEEDLKEAVIELLVEAEVIEGNQVNRQLETETARQVSARVQDIIGNLTEDPEADALNVKFGRFCERHFQS